MAERKEKNYDACARPGEHRDHLCHLMEKGLTTEVQRRSAHPAFACGNCGARANEKADLCNPAKLKTP